MENIYNIVQLAQQQPVITLAVLILVAVIAIATCVETIVRAGLFIQ